MSDLSSVLNELQEISKNITEISNGGLSFNDIFNTLLGTFLGSILTIWLFKSQEKIKIKEELRMEFYKEYRDRFNILSNDCMELLATLHYIESCVEASKNLSDYKKNIYIIKFDDRISIPSWNIDLPQVKCMVSAFNRVLEDLEKIKNTFSRNDIIYNKCPEFHTLICGLYKVRPEIDSIELAYKIIKERDSIDEENVKDKFMEIHNNSINQLAEFSSEFQSLVNSIYDRHKSIELEFLGRYFQN